jgi:FAD/FMN-containing dehydrogenase
LRHIFIGSEGALGVITEVTVKLFPASPHDGWMGGYTVENMQVGFEAIREVMVRGYKPAVVRLYDKPDIDYNFGSVKLKDEEAYMFFTAEGPAEIVKLTGAAIHKIVTELGARDIGTKAVEHWLIHRNDLCQKMDDPAEIEKAKQTMTLYATTEISADWSDIKKIYDDVIANVPPQIEGLVMLGGHVSHSYINGTNIYFVYRYKVSSPENAYCELLKIVHAISRIVLKYPTGGCVHHHGMGKNRIDFAEEEHGTSYALIKSLKKLLDPHNIMCKGNLVKEYDN